MSGRGRPPGSKDTNQRSRKTENAADRAAKSKRKTLDAINQRKEGLRQMSVSLLGGASATQEEAAPGGASLPVASGGDAALMQHKHHRTVAEYQLAPRVVTRFRRAVLLHVSVSVVLFHVCVCECL